MLSGRSRQQSGEAKFPDYSDPLFSNQDGEFTYHPENLTGQFLGNTLGEEGSELLFNFTPTGLIYNVTQEMGGKYFELLDEGYSHDDAMRAALTFGGGVGILDKFGVDALFKHGSGLFKKMLGVGTEVATEGLEAPMGALTDLATVGRETSGTDIAVGAANEMSAATGPSVVAGAVSARNDLPDPPSKDEVQGWLNAIFPESLGPHPEMAVDGPVVPQNRPSGGLQPLTGGEVAPVGEQAAPAKDAGVSRIFAGEVAERRLQGDEGNLVTSDDDTTWRSSKATAEKMLADGTDPETVLKATGWRQLFDGKWSFEIADTDIDFVPNPDVEMGKSGDFRLGDVIKHDTLFKAYPEAENITLNIRISPTQDSDYVSGYMNSDKNELGIVTNGEYSNPTQRQRFLEVVAHELNHYVQNEEGFQGGAAPGKFAGYSTKPSTVRKTLNAAREKSDLTPDQRKTAQADILNLEKREKDLVAAHAERITRLRQVISHIQTIEYRLNDFKSRVAEGTASDYVTNEVPRLEALLQSKDKQYRALAKERDSLYEKRRRIPQEKMRLLESLGLPVKSLAKNPLATELNELIVSTYPKKDINAYDTYRAKTGELTSKETENRLRMTGTQRLEPENYSFGTGEDLTLPVIKGGMDRFGESGLSEQADKDFNRHIKEKHGRDAPDITHGDVITSETEPLYMPGPRGAMFPIVSESVEKTGSSRDNIPDNSLKVKRVTLDTLQDLVPEGVREVRKVEPGKPKTHISGKPYSELDLDKTSGNAAPVTQAQIDAQWDDAIDYIDQKFEGTPARDLVTKLGMKPKPADFWNEAVALPDRARYWYEISAENFRKIMPDLTDDEIKQFISMVAGTSMLANPYDNLRRAVGAYGQDTAGMPIDVDLTSEKPVTDALREGGLEGLKTGSFGGTMQRLLGLENKPQLSTNDRQVAASFGISGEDIASNPILYGVLSKYFINHRDTLNRSLDEGADPYESWQMQALGWVEERARNQGKADNDRPSDDYFAALVNETGDRKNEGIITLLKDAGVMGPNDTVITREMLKDPRLPLALSGTLENYRKSLKATVEIGSPYSAIQKEAVDLVGKAKAAGDNKAVKLYQQTFARALQSAWRSKSSAVNDLARAVVAKQKQLSGGKVSRMQSPALAHPFAYAGTYNNVAAPNMRVPLQGMDEAEQGAFLATLGKAWKQDAMAASTFLANPTENTIPTQSVFTRNISGKGLSDDTLLSEFSAALPDGFEVITEQVPNGQVYHITPKYDDDGNASSIDFDVAKAAIDKVFGPDANVFETYADGVYIHNSDYDGKIGEWETRYTKIVNDYRNFRRSKGFKDASKAVKQSRNKQAIAARQALQRLRDARKRLEKVGSEFETQQQDWVEKYKDKYR